MKALAPYPFPPSQIGDLYASALATTVLQLKELASRPGSWDGVVGLFDVAEGVGRPEQPFLKLMHLMRAMEFWSRNYREV